MKRLFFIASAAFVLFACAPVLNRELMKEGERKVPLEQLRATPAEYKGKLYILGGLIAETRLTDSGSLIEALYTPVDSRGYLAESERVGGRFLAIYPGAKGMLDPVVFKKGREVTLAGAFLETRKGKIDEMEYVFPVFEIKQIYLWEEQRYYDMYPYTYPYYYSYPYPYWYGPPWWGPGPPPPGWW